jgi:hypothetical protein
LKLASGGGKCVKSTLAKIFSEAKSKAPNTRVKGKTPQWAQESIIEGACLRPLRWFSP